MVNYYDLAIGRWEGEGGALEAFRHNATPAGATEYGQKPTVRELSSDHDQRILSASRQSTPGKRIGSVTFRGSHST